jgi:hypothetical protein
MYFVWRDFLRLVLALPLLAAPPGAEAKDAKEKSARRYLIDPNLEGYPQDLPKTALESVLKAIEAKKVDYLLAQLADPAFVDNRVRLYDGNFDDLVKETSRHFANDPTLVKSLKQLAKEGEWETADMSASVFLKANKDKRVFMKKIGTRWYLENRQKEKSKS